MIAMNRERETSSPDTPTSGEIARRAMVLKSRVTRFFSGRRCVNAYCRFCGMPVHPHDLAGHMVTRHADELLAMPATDFPEAKG